MDGGDGKSFDSLLKTNRSIRYYKTPKVYYVILQELKLSFLFIFILSQASPSVPEEVDMF